VPTIPYVVLGLLFFLREEAFGLDMGSYLPSSPPGLTVDQPSIPFVFPFLLDLFSKVSLTSSRFGNNDRPLGILI